MGMALLLDGFCSSVPLSREEMVLDMGMANNAFSTRKKMSGAKQV